MGKKMCRANGGVKASRKPHFESPSRVHIFKFPSLKKPIPVAGLLFLLFSMTLAIVVHWVQDDAIGFSHHFSPFVDWEHRREAVKDAFVTSWDAYSQHAWGKLARDSSNLPAQKIDELTASYSLMQAKTSITPYRRLGRK